METWEPSEERLGKSPEATPGTLGAVLYSNASRRLIPEAEWVALVRSVAAREGPALHALYERANRPVFTLAVRITGSRETAEEVTLDVFHDVWRRAGDYHPENGTVLGWIMNQARSRAIDRLRFEQRLKRMDPGTDDPCVPSEAADPRDMLELKQEYQAARQALALLTPDERRAVEASFLGDLSHAEVAERLDQPLGTIKTRIRSALRKLREALETKGNA